MIRAQGNEFATISSITGASFGVSITPGNNTYGAYVQMLSGAVVTDDAYGIWICVNSNNASGVARDSLAKIGIDPAGGTSYTDFIVDLSCSCAQTGVLIGYGFWYFFPVFIKKNTSIAMAASINNATVGTCLGSCTLNVRPTHPDIMPRFGSFVRTMGSTQASSSGTPFTISNGTLGAYTQVGAALTEPLWYWNLGVGCNNTVMGNSAQAWDLGIGDASNKRLVINQQLVHSTSFEVMAMFAPGAYAQASPGDLVYLRNISYNAPTTGYSAIVYGVGG